MMIKYRSLVLGNLFTAFFGLGICLIPFIWWPGADVAYELPRVWFVHRWVDLLFLTTLLGAKFLPKRHIDMKLFFLLLVFVCVAISASLVGVDMTKSIAGNYWRGDGLITMVRLAGLAIMVGLWWNQKTKQAFLWANMLAVIGICGWVLFESFLNGLNPRGVAFGNPVLLAGWLLVAGSVVLGGFSGEKRYKRLSYLISGLIFITIMVSQVWSALLLWLVVLFFHILFLRILFFLGLVVGGWWWWRKEAQVEYLRGGAVVYESRERIFRKVWGGAWQRPVLGWGWANVDLAFNSFVWPYPVQNDVYLDKAHSSLLEIFATTGLIGLTTYLVLIGRTGWKLRKSYLLLPAVILFMHSQTNIVGIGEEVYFWVFVGVALASS